MASNDSVQALIAAFAFGIAVNAASAAVFLFFKGHGSSLTRDGLRLVLVTFFTTSALWAQIAFIGTLIDADSTSGCQVAISFSSAFDQLARISIEQAMLWGINKGAQKSSALTTLLPQGFLVLRFILGGIFVGFQRPQMDSICVTSNQILPVGVVVFVVDFVFIAFLVARASSVGLLKDVQKDAGRGKAILFSLAGLGVWTATSIPMLLGARSMALIARTAVPAAGLAILIGILTVFKNTITVSREAATRSSPEAPSPRGFDTSRDLQSRDLSTADSNYAPSRYEDVKGGTRTEISSAARQPAGPNGGLPFIWGPSTTQASVGVGGLPVQGQLFPPMRSQTAPVITESRQPNKKVVVKKGGKLVISSPIVNATKEENPWSKIATIDLATAAKNEKERRDLGQLPPSINLMEQSRVPQASRLSTEEMMKRERSLKRKEVGADRKSSEAVNASLGPQSETAPTGTSTSAQLSPGVEEIRRRSPRQAPQPFKEETPPSTPANGQQTPKTRSVTPPKRPERPETTASLIEAATITPPARSSRRPPPPTSSVQPSMNSKSNERGRDSSAPQRSISSASSRARAPIASDVPDVPHPVRTMEQPRPDNGGATTQVSIPPIPKDSVAFFPKPLQRQGSNETVGTVSSRMSILPRNNSVKTNIRPSRQRPRTPPEEVPAMPHPPAVKNGLPRNPRANATKSMKQDQTVMFINSIEYNNPSEVRDVMDDATAKSPMARALSVVHRPRPIPRKPSIDRSIFPAEDSPNMHQHRRSMSAGSIRKKSILYSAPGSPGQLPPLPPLPKSAGNALRPQPNDTRSMTWDEKMKMFYPTPQGAASNSTKSMRRRSASLPELPVMPAAYAEHRVAVQEEFPTNPLLGNANPAKTPLANDNSTDADAALDQTFAAPNVSKFSITTYQSTIPPTQSWMMRPQMQERKSSEGAKRRSSPVLPAEGLDSPSVNSEYRNRDDEETATNWGSIHSPVEPVNIQRARAVEVPPVPKVAPCPNQISHDDAKSSPLEDGDDGKETMTVMLDPSLERSLTTTPVSKQTEMSLQREQHVIPWHRRVGERCPTFSARRHTVKARKVLPPAPLLLHRSNTVSIAAQAEPSPLESPDHALEQIQQQLKRFEEPNRDSTGSEQQKQRMTLLANLEMEMGLQQNHWEQMRNDLSVRDSFSTMQGSPSQESAYGSVRNSVTIERMRSTIADRRASRGTNTASRASTEIMDFASPASNTAHASQWRRRLTEAQMDHLDILQEANTNANLLTVAMVSQVQLGSPTPPDTDESEFDCDEPATAQAKAFEKSIPVTGLWRPADNLAGLSEQVTVALWDSSMEKQAQAQHATELQFPGLSIRPPSRKIAEPLTIESSQLWEKPVNTRRFSTQGLWRPAAGLNTTVQESTSSQPPQQQEKASRPVTQRPPRRSKRITMLPDIPESPKPLPDKRGTLGIFQFPWGERSDSAYIQPRPQMFMAMPGTMTSGRPGMNNAAAAPAPAPVVPSQRIVMPDQFTTSFFDDYEQEDEGDNFSDYDMEEYNSSDYEDRDEEEDDDDDDFDETTLWEIASLLKTNQIPSRDSLFPTDGDGAPHTPSKIDSSAEREGSSYTAGDHSEFDSEESKHDSLSLVVDTSAFPSPPRAGTGAGARAATGAPTGAAARTSTLWTNKSERVQLTGVYGLAQPDERTWASYLLSVDVVPAPPRPRGAAEPALLSSSSLWSQGSIKNEDAQSAWLSVLDKKLPTLLWAPSISNSPRQQNFGLPQPNPETWNLYLPSSSSSPQEFVVRLQTRKPEPASVITSTTLWSRQETPSSPQQHGLLWTPKKSRNSDTGMWSLAPPVEILSKGLPQPDAAAWSAYLPQAQSIARVKARKLDPATVDSTSLWAPTPRKTETPHQGFLWALKPQSQPVSPMWAPAAPVEIVSYGLAQPQASVWLNYVPSTHDAVRIKPRKDEVAVVESTELWQKTEKVIVESAVGFLWGAAESLLSKKDEAAVIPPTSSIGMWTPPPVVETEEEPAGLFSTSHKRTEFRRTSQEPAALKTVRKPRVTTDQPLPRLMSARLWSHAPLWAAPAVTEPESSEGLFSLSHKRSNFRTTPEDPAALKTVRKIRVIKAPLAKLTSDSLWSVPTATTYTQDWISVSTKAVRSASMSSESTVTESTEDDASSVKSDATKASTVGSMFASIGASFRKAGWKKASAPPVPPMEPTKEEEDSSPSSAKSSRLHRPTVSMADWDAALDEAIRAGKKQEAAAVSQLWVKRHAPPAPLPAPAASLVVNAMWQHQPKDKSPVSPAQSAFVEQQTAPSRRPRSDKMTPDFSAQALWTRAELVEADVKHWLHGSVQLQY